MLRKTLMTIIVFIAILGVGYACLLTTTVTEDKGVIYYLPIGNSKPRVIAHLSQQGIIKFPFLLSLYSLTQRSAQLKAGEYLFPKGSNTLSVWRQLITGRGLYYRSFTIIPGWSFSQLRRELIQTETLKHNSGEMDDKQIMALLGEPTIGPEGQFFPETYYYTRGVPDLVILKRAFDLMRLRVAESWESRLPGLPYQSPYDALIAASLIEKEAFLPSERPVIASVLINRLRKHMLLQFDPTVIYGLGDQYTGKIRKQDLLRDTKYNTYLHKGLPPTPISMPSMPSIEAALHPEATDYLYFVARGDGSHQFSKTLAEHNAAVATSRSKKTTFFNQSLLQSYLPYSNLKAGSL